jgi:hypothetical protein
VGKKNQQRGQIDERREDFIEQRLWDGKMHDFGGGRLAVAFGLWPNLVEPQVRRCNG